MSDVKPNLLAIEVTPAMVEAGVEKLFLYDPDYSDAKKAVMAIFSAMMAVRTARSRSTSVRDD